MRESLIEFLVCPFCSSDLKISEGRQENGEIKEGIITCQGCSRNYPIMNFIPRFLPKAHYRLFDTTSRNFGFSWHRFDRIYTDPRDFLDWIKPVTPDFFYGKRVVDAGCGTGMHALYAAEFGASEVIAFDLSPAVEVARENVHGLPQVHVIQADIYHLPLKQAFDYVYCLGVIQHLPRPQLGFLKLVQLLKKDGWLSIWVYGYEGTRLVRLLIDPIRRLTSKLPLSLVYIGTFWPTAIFYLLTRGIKQSQKRFFSGKKESLLTTIPLGEYFLYMSQFNFHYLHNSVFDQLIAPITQYFRRKEVENWFRTAGLTDIQMTWRNQMSWRALGRRAK